MPVPDRAGMREVPYVVMTSADEEVEDVHAGAGLRAIQLGVSALAAGDGRLHRATLDDMDAGDEFVALFRASLKVRPWWAAMQAISQRRHALHFSGTDSIM